MRNRSLSNLTRTYELALSIIAFLTLATVIVMHQVILTQTDSAHLVNLSGSQRWLSQKITLLSIKLVCETISMIPIKQSKGTPGGVVNVGGLSV